MQITTTLSWSSVNWPVSSAATQYALFQMYPTPSTIPLQIVTGTSATLSYEEITPQLFQIRPTDGVQYGPEVTAFVNGELLCRAWIRQKIRYALADQAASSGVQVNWSDSEINTYIGEALTEVSLLFPFEADTTIKLQPSQVDNDGIVTGTRNYPLPANCYLIRSVEYITQDGKLHLFLKEKPFRGGESTATTYLGYPKLGIMLSPLAGRFYPGHYDMYEQQINLDWDPAGDGDELHIRYVARYATISDDITLLTLKPEDIELISLRTQMKCWLRVEGQDTRLSRWRGKDDGGRRDDMPTIKMSMMIKQLYNELVNDRRELRPKFRRLVRR